MRISLLLAALLLQAQAPTYDLIIRNGRIIDGAGNPWRAADLAVRGDTIVAIAPHVAGTAARVIDARGQAVTPGFIDLHTHARRGIQDVPTAENYARQGVTTILEGPDGSSPLPIKDFLDSVAARKTSVNFGTFVGQGSIRDKIIGPINRKATPEEIERMKALVRQGMEDGAFGLSSGLFYVPGVFTPTEEVIELAKVAGQMGGIYISHMRNEAAGILDSVRETIEIGEKGGLPAQLTHHKIIGTGNWGKSVDSLRLVAEARARGVDVTIDQYPYTASSTGMQQLFPPWALEGGAAEVRKRLANPSLRADIKGVVVQNIKFDRGGGDPKNIQIASCQHDPTLAGKNLAEITRARGKDPTIENAADTAMDIVEKGGASAIFHAINEADVERIMKDPNTMIASDGEVPIFGRNSPHPRSYGTNARVLAMYVREKRILTLEDAIRRMTSLPAGRIGLADRGVLRPGMKADLVIFDPAKVQDKATFANPHQYAEGYMLVAVNGQIIFENGKMTEARPGRVLYGPSKK